MKETSGKARRRKDTDRTSDDGDDGDDGDEDCGGEGRRSKMINKKKQ